MALPIAEETVVEAGLETVVAVDEVEEGKPEDDVEERGLRGGCERNVDPLEEEAEAVFE